MVTYFKCWRLPQYLTQIHKQFTTVSLTVFRHSSSVHHLFKFIVITTVSMESVDLVCANGTWLRTRRAGLQSSHLWRSNQSTDPRPISPILHETSGKNNPFFKTKNFKVPLVNNSGTNHFPKNSYEHPLPSKNLINIFYKILEELFNFLHMVTDNNN